MKSAVPQVTWLPAGRLPMGENAMQTLYLFGSDYATPNALHQALRRLMHLPPHYGMNADALYDCLTERQEPVHLHVFDPGHGDTAKALQACAAAIVDAGGQVTGL